MPDACGVGGYGFLGKDMLASFDASLSVPRPKNRGRCQQHDLGIGVHDLLIAVRAAEGVFNIASVLLTDSGSLFLEKVGGCHQNSFVPQTLSRFREITCGTAAASAAADHGELEHAAGLAEDGGGGGRQCPGADKKRPS